MPSPTDPRVASFWQAYLALLPPETARAARPGAVFAFDDNPAGAAFCVRAVLSGEKTATSQLAAEDPPELGALEIVTEHDGTPRAVIRIAALDRCRFGDVDEDFARAEGDGTLAAWRATHRRYYAARCARRGETLTGDTLLRRIFFARVWPPAAG